MLKTYSDSAKAFDSTSLASRSIGEIGVEEIGQVSRTRDQIVGVVQLLPGSNPTEV